MAILNRTDIYEGGRALDEVKKEIKEIIELQKQLQKATRDVNTTGSGSEAKERVKITNQLAKANKRLIEAESEHGKQLALINEATRQAKRENTQLAKEKLKIIGAYQKESKRLIDLRKQYKDLAIQNRANTKEAKNLLGQITKLDRKLKQVDATVGQNQRNVGNYRSALKGLGSQILGAAGIVGGVSLMVNGFQNLAAKVNILNKGTRQIVSTFKVANNEARALSSQIAALAGNFDKDFNEILQSANAVSKEFGISASEALNLIEDGFRKGSDNGGEFLDILREYPAQLQSVGLNAEESFAIINQQVKAGVYSDKGIDAIKEAGLSLRENTKAVQAALSPIKETVRAEIDREVAAGNTFKAMQLISGELDNLNTQQKQLIIADIFKGAGEDALTFVENLDEVNLSLADTESQLSDVEEANLELSKTWNSLVNEVSTGSSFISKAWAGLLRIASGLVEQLNYWLSGQNKINAATKRSIGFQGRLDKLLAAQTAKIESITDKEAQRAHLLERYNKLTLALAEAERDAAIARQSGTKKEVENAIIRIELINGLIDGLRKYVPELREQNKVEKTNTGIVTSNNDVRTKRKETIDKEAKSLKELNDQLQREAEFKRKREKDRLGLVEGEQDDATTANAVNAIAAAQFAAVETDKIQQKQQDEAIKRAKEAAEKIIEIEQQKQQAIADIKNTFEQEATSLAINAASQIVDDKKNKELNRIQAEEDALKNQLDKELINEIQYQTKLAELEKQRRTEEARAAKRQALYEIAINTAVSAAKVLFNPIALARVLATGAIQAAFVAARPLPKFEKGGWHKGKSHKQGGEIVEVEGGEFTVNKHDAQNAPMLLDSINRGLIRDVDLGMNKKQKDKLTASLLMQGLGKYDKLIGLMSNMAYSYEYDGKLVIVPIDGSDKIYKNINR